MTKQNFSMPTAAATAPLPLKRKKRAKVTKRPVKEVVLTKPPREIFLEMEDEDKTTLMLAGLSRYETNEQKRLWLASYESAWRAGEPCPEPGSDCMSAAKVDINPVTKEVTVTDGRGVRVDTTQARYDFLQEVDQYMKNDAGIKAFMEAVNLTIGCTAVVIAAPAAGAAFVNGLTVAVIVTVGDYAAKYTSSLAGWLLAAGVISYGSVSAFLVAAAKKLGGGMKWLYDQMWSLVYGNQATETVPVSVCVN